MKNLPTQRGEGDKGFTLIELMVVVLIIAILLAIAIPTFLGAQNKAKDRSAQSSARNALTNAKTIFADTGVYSDVTVAKLTTSEPSLTFTAAVSTTPKMVSMVSTAIAWYGAVKSETGTCFYIVDSVGPTGAGTKYASAAIGTGAGEVATCVASATAPADTAYTDKW
jgi:type IV pilus assembly protein PilA